MRSRLRLSLSLFFSLSLSLSPSLYFTGGISSSSSPSSTKRRSRNVHSENELFFTIDFLPKMKRMLPPLSLSLDLLATTASSF